MSNEILKSYPKINLFLIVKKKKSSSGLHKIDSLFCKYYDIYDEIEISVQAKSKHDKVEYFKNNKILEIEDCILLKTLKLFREKNLIKNFYRIKVDKKIPLASGLGGSSSNAATLIKFLMGAEEISVKNLKKLLLIIGSDVSFFMSDYDCARVRGFGEKIKKVRSIDLSFKVETLNFKCHTKDVFKSFDDNQKLIKQEKTSFKKQMNFLVNGQYALLRNDLALPCFLIYPDFKKIYNSIERKQPIHLSGSGSSVFYFTN